MQRNGKLFLLVCLSITSGCLKRELPEYEQVGSHYKFKLRDQILFDKNPKNGSVAYGYLYKQKCKTVDWMNSLPKDSKMQIFLNTSLIVPKNNSAKYDLAALTGYKKSFESELNGFEKWWREEKYPHGTSTNMQYISDNAIAQGGGYYYLRCHVNPRYTMEQVGCGVFYNVLDDVGMHYGIRAALFPQFAAIDQCIRDFVTSVARPIAEN
jgi:hypothetical protein